MKITFFWDVVVCSLAEIDRPDDGSSKHVRNSGQFLRDHTRQPSSVTQLFGHPAILLRNQPVVCAQAANFTLLFFSAVLTGSFKAPEIPILLFLNVARKVRLVDCLLSYDGPCVQIRNRKSWQDLRGFRFVQRYTEDTTCCCPFRLLIGTCFICLEMSEDLLQYQHKERCFKRSILFKRLIRRLTNLVTNYLTDKLTG
jgi:hypothetical protein